MQTDLSISICARKATDQYKHGDYSHMLSLLDPHEPYDDIIIPDSTQHLGRIMFHDLDDIEVRAPQYCTYMPPQKSHVLQISEFFKHVSATGGHGILIHCEAGISRSTASAIVGLCSLGVEPEASFEYITGLIEMALPNRRLLRLADETFWGTPILEPLAEKRRKWLFEKYEQPDPLQQLKAELDKKGWASLRIERMQHWSNYALKYLRSMAKRKRRHPGKPSCFLKHIGRAGAMA